MWLSFFIPVWLSVRKCTLLQLGRMGLYKLETRCASLDRQTRSRADFVLCEHHRCNTRQGVRWNWGAIQRDWYEETSEGRSGKLTRACACHCTLSTTASAGKTDEIFPSARRVSEPRPALERNTRETHPGRPSLVCGNPG